MMQTFERYKWYIFAGFACIGLAFGVLADALLFGIVFGLALGFLAMALIAVIIKVNYKQ
jgi:hypothetical protein